MMPAFRCDERATDTMQELNAITKQIKDMQGRLDALRGYL